MTSLAYVGHFGELHWVMWQGEEHHVKEWAHLPPGDRPRTTCPACGREVVLKLGRRRVFHAAHRPGDACPATHPETASHYNAKFALAAELRRLGRLTVVERCVDVLPSVRRQPARQCPTTRTRQWLNGWDAVVVEAQLGSLRPDVQMLRDGVVIGAVEILQTHAVPEVKKEALRLLGLPWLEVRAAAILGHKAAPWTAESPLEVVREAPSRRWQCPEHEAAEHTRVQREAEEQQASIQREQYRRTSGPRRWWVRVVDVYLPGAVPRRERFLYEIVEVHREGAIFGVRLGHNRRTKPVLSLEAPDLGDREARLAEAFQADCREREQILGAVVDSPMEWIEVGSPVVGNAEEPFLSVATFPERYVWTAEGWRVRPGMAEAPWPRP